MPSTTDYLIVTPRGSAPTTRTGYAQVYADSGTGKIRFLSSAGTFVEAGMADKAVTAASDPGTPAEGQLYANTTSHTLKFYDGSTWQTLAMAAGSVPSTRTITTTAPLAGGGDLSANRVLSLTLASVTPGLSVVGGGLAVSERAFSRSCTLSSAAAQTPVVCLSDADVGAGKVAYLTHWRVKVNGATPWVGPTGAVIKDTAGNAFVTIPVGELLGNAFIDDAGATVVLANPYALGTGTASGKGIQVVADMSGAGSDLVLTIGGTIR